MHSGGPAEVFLDGDLIGTTPLRREVKTGTHEFVIKRGDGEPETHTLAIGIDEPARISAFDPEAEITVARRVMPFSSQAIEVGSGTLDVMLGWPYIGEVRINGGVYDKLDIGFTFRTAFDAVSEFEGRAKYQFLRFRAFGLAAEAGIGGGGGSKDRNSFIFRTRALASVFIGDKVAVTARFGIFVFSDKLALTDDNVGVTNLPADSRDSGLELHTGLTVEFEVAESWNCFLLFDGMPVRTGPHTGRLILNEGVVGEAKNHRFRAAAGVSLGF